ncbi:MAG TPA: intradiol ring-cleavage dioxygenase [Reyranella sp.]|jgi:protocatechuate 3,4-dioxygenase beta subunit
MTRLLLPNRRRLLAFGAALPFARRAQAAPCTLAAEQEVGPFYIADEAMRGDIVEDRVGLPLTLRLQVLDSRTCRPLPAAAVDLWQCDAMGLYSGFTQMPDLGPPPERPKHGILRRGPPPVMRPSNKLTFLRGIQRTDNEGVVRFHTIFPGVYPGRTNHIHFKIHVRDQVADHVAHVGQVFFPEETAVSILKRPPYSGHRLRRTTQAEDGIFRGQGGASSIADVKMDGEATVAVADLVVAVDPTATPAPVGFGRPD